MRYPEFIGDNDTIGFVAPSFGCAMEPYISAFNSAVEYFKADGRNVQFGPNVYKGCGIGTKRIASDGENAPRCT